MLIKTHRKSFRRKKEQCGIVTYLNHMTVPLLLSLSWKMV